MKNIMIKVVVFVIAFLIWAAFYKFVWPLIGGGDQSRQMAGYD